MITVNAALEQLFALVAPMPEEDVPLRDATGRTLVRPVHAKRTQPPFDASSMDGYALKSVELEQHAQFKVIGEAAAGHGFSGKVGAGQAVRIFTGAPVPEGANCVVIQEDVTRTGDLITVVAEEITKNNIRPAGADFGEGQAFSKTTPLAASDIALLAAMNQARVPVYCQPVIAIIPTGDELVQPGEDPGPDQIIASNSYGLASLMEAHGARTRLLPIAKDSAASLKAVFARCRDADLIVTIGGASVGDHDLVADVAGEMGMQQTFYKVAMRPGKPLMAGRFGDTPMVGLPGNPVSAMVCGAVFLLPMLRVMLGQPSAPAPRVQGQLAHDIGPNGPREHYMRAVLQNGTAEIFEKQDSSLLHILAEANALAIRPPNDPARPAGDTLEFTLL